MERLDPIAASICAPQLPPAVAAGGIVLHLVRLDVGEATAAAALLTDTERAKAARIVVERPRAVAFLSRAFLRRVLAERLGVPPRRVPIEADRNGKPQLAVAGPPPLHFNVSHSDTLLAIATAGHPVGVDVEAHRAFDDLERLAARVLRPQEAAALAARAPTRRPAAFLELWCAKEAVMKADGRGLLIEPRTIVLDPPFPSPGARGMARLAPSGAGFAVRSLAADRAALAVAWPAPLAT